MRALRYLWLFLFVLLIGIASYLAEEIFFPVRPSVPKNSIEWTIHLDFKKLNEEGQLPPELNQVRQIFTLDRRQQQAPINWQEVSKFHFPQKSDGIYDLQLEIFSTEDPNQKPDPNDPTGIIIQYSLFDTKTKNKIWELTRTYKGTEK